MNAIILHGTMGSPSGNWFIWLKHKLESRGMAVWLPELPNPEQPSLRDWSDFIHENCPFTINDQTLIVGHSSGAVLAIILAQENKSPIGEVVAVSAFHNNSLNWEANSRLFDVEFHWEAVRTNTKKLLFIHSDDDPYVPLEQARYIADKCHAKILVMPGQGHFNLEKSDSYREFPKLLEEL